ncbi:MAG: GspE/PulE family protein [Planctomycetota bacterium]|jgi:type IV pilus assembly protein PilB
MLSERKLGNVLVQEGVLSPEELREALDYQHKTRLGLKASLLDLNLLSEEEIIVALVSHFGFSHLRLRDYEIEQAAIAKVPKDKCQQYTLIPVSLTDNLLTVAFADPLNIPAIDELKLVTSCEILPVIAKESEIKEAVDKYYDKQSMSLERYEGHKLAETEDDFGDMAMFDDTDVEEYQEEEEDEDSEVDDAPAIKLANFLVHDAVRMSSSDIHVEPRERDVGIRYRLDGVLRDQKPIPKHFQRSLVSRFKIMAEMDIAERRIPQDGRIRLKVDRKIIDLRVSCLPTRWGEKIVLRILDKSSLTLDLDQLGFEDQPLRIFKAAMIKPNGILLVTGPTGSGKTTTLYATLHALNRPEVNIVTVEEPIEYELFRINQVPVNVDAGLTFPAALRSILRQDPDIVMIGEIRDIETLSIAVKAALTGHLVLSTLHTNDAPSSIIRLIDMGTEQFLVASSMEMVCAQRLLRKICDKCKEPAKYPAATLERIPEEFRGATFYRARGCPECSDTGFKGRIGALEAMLIDEPVQKLIMGTTNAHMLKKAAIEGQGMHDLKFNSTAKASRGLTTLEEVFRVTG